MLGSRWDFRPAEVMSSQRPAALARPASADTPYCLVAITPEECCEGDDWRHKTGQRSYLMLLHLYCRALKAAQGAPISS